MIFHILWQFFSLCFPSNKSDLMVALCCVYTGCLGEANGSHSCVRCSSTGPPGLLYPFHQNQSWDLSTVTVPFSSADKADHTEQTMLNWKIRFWSRGLFLTLDCARIGPSPGSLQWSPHHMWLLWSDADAGPDTFADLPARKTFMVKCEAGKRELRTNRRAVFLQPLFYFVQLDPESTFPCQGKYDRVCKVCMHAG